MKTTARLSVVAAVLCALSSAAQDGDQYRFLQPGESVAYSFDSLPHSGPFGDTVPTPPQGVFSFNAFPNVTPDAVLRFELFEQSSADTPLFVGLWSQNSPQFGAQLLNAWQDRQGVIRFTGVSGTTGFDSFTVTVLTPVDTFHYDRYSQTFAAVPEPSTTALGMLGFSVGFYMLR